MAFGWDAAMDGMGAVARGRGAKKHRSSKGISMKGDNVKRNVS